MRAHHLITVVVILFVVIAGLDAAVTSFAHPTFSVVSQSAPPVAPLLFGGD
ncbi:MULTISPECIES: hypothetical protein [unclassified Bradyrhizobium]